jgi:hypothetical protein
MEVDHRRLSCRGSCLDGNVARGGTIVQDRGRRPGGISPMPRSCRLAPIGAVLALAACAPGAAGTARPVLYPNATFNQVGRAQADADIAACEQMARAAGTSEGSQAGELGRRAAIGTGVGAATGAIIGAVTGNFGKGAAIGAATGAAGGITSGAFDSDAGVNQTYRNFVTRCLAEKGYEVVGFE